MLDHLAALVDKSLVQAEEIHGSTRYRLLETVRHYAAERLALRPGSELDETRAAHRDHYLALVETADTHLRGPDEAVWLDRLEVEFDNIRAALAFSLADPDSAEPGLRLAAGLRWFCNMRGHGGEVLEALNVLLERPDARMPTRTRARALTASCHLLDHFGDDSPVPSLAGEAIRIARGLADDAVAADALSQLCWFRFEHGDLPAALAQIDEAVGLARTTGDPRLIADILGRRAVFKGEAGDLDAAFADQQEALTLSRAAGDNYRLAITLANLGVDELAAGELRAARAHLQEASMLADNLGYQNLSVGLRQNLGFVDLIDADPRNARRHFLDSLDTARITGVKSYVHAALLGLALAAGADGDPAVAATLHGVADEQLRAGRTGFRGPRSGAARPRPCPPARHAGRCRVRGRLRARPHAQPSRRHRPGHRSSRARSRGCVRRHRSRRRPGDGGRFCRPAVGTESGRSWRCWPAGRPTPRSPGGCSCRSTRCRSHLERIRDKTGARRRTELVRYAIQAGIDPVAPAP